MKVMQSSLITNWEPGLGWQQTELNLLVKLKFIDDEVRQKIMGMITSRDLEMRKLGDQILEAHWDKHVSAIINIHNMKNENIKLLRSSSQG